MLVSLYLPSALMKASHCTGETGHVAVLKPGALFEKAMEKKSVNVCLVLFLTHLFKVNRLKSLTFSLG